LTNSSVPISIDRKAEGVAGPEDSRVIQDDLKKYLPSTGANPVNTDSPLLLFKLSIANTETAIGVSWHHTLGDATVLLQFMLILSRTYHELRGDLESIPTFTKYHFLSPPQDVVEQYLPLMSHLSRTYELAALAARYAEMNVNICRVDARINEEKLGHLRDKFVEAAGGTVNLSRQDCLSAYIANVLGRCLGIADSHHYKCRQCTYSSRLITHHMETSIRSIETFRSHASRKPLQATQYTSYVTCVFR
ncbi:uncharacterized protein LAESUDRAFT_642583, partial [Laetiporus sulphureus 93-53]